MKINHKKFKTINVGIKWHSEEYRLKLQDAGYARESINYDSNGNITSYNYSLAAKIEERLENNK